MPIPLIFIGIAALSGATGLGSTVKAGFDQAHARKVNMNSDERIQAAANRLEGLRAQCGNALQQLGEEKVAVLDQSIKEFLETFTKIKNVDFTASEGLLELNKLHVDRKTFDAGSVIFSAV